MLWQRMQTCKSQFFLTFDFANEVLKVQIRNTVYPLDIIDNKIAMLLSFIFLFSVSIW